MSASSAEGTLSNDDKDTRSSTDADTDTDFHIGWLTVSAGEEYTCGLWTAASVECWGSDSEGQSSPPEL
jgi:hypothetical protein